MLEHYKSWYKGLSSIKQLALSFIYNWIYWFVIWIFVENYLLGDDRSVTYHFFYATWMAFFMSIPFNWKKIKALFKK